MGIEIINVRKEHLPSLRLIGHCYTDADRDTAGGFGSKWGKWFQNGWFEELEKLDLLQNVENGYLGLMGGSEKENSFQYWIGMFFPENTPVPEGFESVDIPEGDVGVCWIKGREDTGEIYGETAHNMCMEKLTENGMGICRDDFHGSAEKWRWFFERYNCPRFTEKNEDGTVILDYGMYVK